MIVKKLTLSSNDFPDRLKTIHTPPKELFVTGENLINLLQRPCVTIVGSRRVTTYGKAVTAKLAGDLARAGVVVISGLAIGVDGIAHKAALEAGGISIAVLPSGLDEIYPAHHHQLAMHIVKQGGALVSEYPEGTPAFKWNFVERNRIAAGLCDALLVTEAAQKSGTLHTARFALEQGKDVLAVPGNITSPTSAGTNNLIRTGATPITCTEDILHVLGIESFQTKLKPKGDTPEQQVILDLLSTGEDDGGAMLALSRLEVTAYNQALTMLEITGKVRALGSNKWALT